MNQDQLTKERDYAVVEAEIMQATASILRKYGRRWEPAQDQANLWAAEANKLNDLLRAQADVPVEVRGD